LAWPDACGGPSDAHRAHDVLDVVVTARRLAMVACLPTLTLAATSAAGGRCEATLPLRNFMRTGPRPSDGAVWRWWFGSGAAAADDGGGAWWPVATAELPCSTMESRGRQKASQNRRTPSCGGAHQREGRWQRLGQKPAKGRRDPALSVTKRKWWVPRGVSRVLWSGGSS
jgi:hypothetical protein